MLWQHLQCMGSIQNLTIQQVDSFFAKQKQVIGFTNFIWQPGNAEYKKTVKFPIEVDSVQYGENLIINAHTNTKGKYSILISHEFSYCRLDITPNEEIHNNGFNPYNLPHHISGSHFHSWELNKNHIANFNKLSKLQYAEKFNETTKLMSALRWFCAKTNISLPFDASIELPQMEKLI